MTNIQWKNFENWKIFERVPCSGKNTVDSRKQCTLCKAIEYNTRPKKANFLQVRWPKATQNQKRYFKHVFTRSNTKCEPCFFFRSRLWKSHTFFFFEWFYFPINEIYVKVNLQYWLFDSINIFLKSYRLLESCST